MHRHRRGAKIDSRGELRRGDVGKVDDRQPSSPRHFCEDAAKREAILAAAARRFAQDGLDRASVETIASEAEVSTATLYRQFPSKLDLFAAVLSERVAEFGEVLQAPGDEDARARIERLARRYARLIDEPQAAGVLRAAFAAAPSTPKIAALFFENVKAAVAGAFHAAVAAGVAGRILRRTKDPAQPGGHLMGMIEHAILWRRLLAGGDGERPPDAIAADALDTFWRAYGLDAPPAKRAVRTRRS